ncbi:MAG TPA: tetratricopeptide repeat protein, partial [Stellaceae bacterium]|nr:tetratricopeptide repeat protein [Stellaceae bacterium]
LLLTGAGPPPEPPLLPGDEAAKARFYHHCLDLATSAPEQAQAMAKRWEEAGGGFPARHCSAAALIGLKHFAEGAEQLQTLAAAMMLAPIEMRANSFDQAGQAWLMANRPAEAEGAFNSALDLRPDDPDFLVDRARALFDEEAYNAAIADLDRAAELTPGRAEIFLYRATAYRAEQDFAKARHDLDEALRLSPNNPGVLLERGNLSRLTGDLAGARRDWKAIIAGNPADDPNVTAAKANLVKLKNVDPNP